MYELVEFLIGEQYCYSEKEAYKIIESVSDDFYNHLVEESDGYSDKAKQVRTLNTELQNPRTSSARQQEIRIALAKLGRERRIETQGQTALKKIQGKETKPRASSGRAQTTDIGVTKTAEAKAKARGISMTGSTLNNPRVASAASREASRLTGTTAEVGRAGGSSQSTGVVRTGKYSDMQVGGRATASTPNRGQSRTGVRFPRQLGE
jgi:hypothetical protein